MFFTYIHRKVSDNSVFYVGMGSKQRANGFKHRSEEWKNVAQEGGVYSEICAKWDTRDEAYEHEKLLISCFKDMGHKLVNKSIGGAGPGAGVVPSKKTRELISKARAGMVFSTSHREALRLSHLGRPHPKPLHICLDCGKVTTNQWLMIHQQKENHVGKAEL